MKVLFQFLAQEKKKGNFTCKYMRRVKRKMSIPIKVPLFSLTPFTQDEHLRDYVPYEQETNMAGNVFQRTAEKCHVSTTFCNKNKV